VKQNLPLSFVELLFDRLDPDRFMGLFLEALTGSQKVERGSIWLKKGDGYVCVEARGDEADKIRGYVLSPTRKSIVGTVIESGRMTIARPDKDPRHFKEIGLKLDTKNTLILCFPLKSADGTVYGAVQILDTTAGGVRMNLDPDYLELLEGLVITGSIALGASFELANQYERKEEIKKVRDRARSEPRMVGQSEAFFRVMGRAKIYAGNDFPVMITGESGTGKELLAREIHRLSPRRNRSFLVQNCSAIPENLLESELFGYRKGAFTGADKDKIGLFEAAEGGTVFLDEVGDMAPGLQAKILRVLQDHEIKPLGSTASKKVDVRIIAATNRKLADSIERGNFREDLYYRLNVLPLEIPAIRKRREDVPLLLNHFLKQYARGPDAAPVSISSEAMEMLTAWSWPGNIREIENLAKYLLTVTEGNINLADLPPPYNLEFKEEYVQQPDSFYFQSEVASPPPTLGTGGSLEEMERAYILSTLEKNRWNITEAARQAGIKRTTFHSRMKKHGIRKKI